MNIFVGNLLFDATQGDVKKLFEGFGNVSSVVIVMSKEKKILKSRGFGFVEMPDEQQALSAISALNGRQFMGRALKVNPAHHKTEVYRSHSSKEEYAKFETGHKQYSQRKTGQNTSFNTVFNKQGTYGGGRRTRSYVKQQALAGMPVEFKPRRKGQQDNPMRWRKNKDNLRPWQKSIGEHKPWQKSTGEHKPWQKSTGEHKPWERSGKIEGNNAPSRTRGRKKPDSNK